MSVFNTSGVQCSWQLLLPPVIQTNGSLVYSIYQVEKTYLVQIYQLPFEVHYIVWYDNDKLMPPYWSGHFWIWGTPLLGCKIQDIPSPSNQVQRVNASQSLLGISPCVMRIWFINVFFEAVITSTIWDAFNKICNYKCLQRDDGKECSLLSLTRLEEKCW